MYLKDLCNALGWQGGTIHQVLAEITRLKQIEKQAIQTEEAFQISFRLVPNARGAELARLNRDESAFSNHEKQIDEDIKTLTEAWRAMVIALSPTNK